MLKKKKKKRNRVRIFCRILYMASLLLMSLNAIFIKSCTNAFIVIDIWTFLLKMEKFIYYEKSNYY